LQKDKTKTIIGPNLGLVIVFKLEHCKGLLICEVIFMDKNVHTLLSLLPRNLSQLQENNFN